MTSKSLLKSSAMLLVPLLLAGPAFADATVECNVGTGTDSTECGVNAIATQAGGVAVGNGATASGPSGANPIFATVAVGFNALAHDNAIAIGNTATARFSGTATLPNTGVNSAVAVGANAAAIGANVIAIGTTARAGNGFTLNTPNSPVEAGSNIVVLGGRAESNQNDTVAVGANAEVTAERATVVGSQVIGSQAGGTAFGFGAQALGPSTTNPIFASAAFGYNALAFDNAVAIGNSAIARFSGTVNPVNIGINSSTVMGGNAVGVGANNVVIGSTARGGTGFAFNSPSDAVDAGGNQTVIGGRAEANALGGTAIGANSEVSGEDGTALGQNTQVTVANAVAIGSGSIADIANTVSFGSAGNTRRLVNVATGVDPTDAVNVAQLEAAIAAGNVVVTGGGGVSTATGAGALASGDNSNANGAGAVALGQNQTATGNGAVAIGDPNTANGQGAVAIGANNNATGNGAVALGNGSTANGAGNVAIGNGASAAAANSAALGGNAQATANNSVAIGQGSVANQANTVSVGAAGSERRVTNVADGAAATDAATVGQLTSTSNILQNNINAEAAARGLADTVLQGNINAEAAFRAAADATLQGNIDAEAVLRAAADTAEANARMAADLAETNARIAADVSLQNQISAIGAGLTDVNTKLERLEDYTASSTATAIALGGATFIPGKTVNMSVNLSTYDGASAGAMNLAVMLSDDVALHGGVAHGFNKGGKTGARVGVAFGW